MSSLISATNLVSEGTQLPLRETATFWTCLYSIVLLSRASFPQHTPTLVYLDVVPLNIYAEIHYLSIKYLSACEPGSDNMYFLLQAQSGN